MTHGHTSDTIAPHLAGEVLLRAVRHCHLDGDDTDIYDRLLVIQQDDVNGLVSLTDTGTANSVFVRKLQLPVRP